MRSLPATRSHATCSAPLGLAVLSLLACGSEQPTRLESRAVIEGRVLLAPGEGLADQSRVQVSLGQGEGGLQPDAAGGFRFADLEPDLYTLRVVYNGGLLAEAQGSAYVPYETRVTALAGSATNLGLLALALGSGTVRGAVALPAGQNPSGVEVRLDGGSLGPALSGPLQPDASFTFSAVPVGRYALTLLGPGLGAEGLCGQPVVVAFDGHAVLLPTLATSAVLLTPQEAVIADGVWYLRGSSLQVDASAAFVGADGLACVQVDGGSCTLSAFAGNGVLQVSGLAEGRHGLRFLFQDGCGLVTAVERSLVVDQSAPVVHGLQVRSTVDSGAEYTRVMAVLVTFDSAGPEAPRRMQVACGGALEGEPWLDFTASHYCLLKGGEGRNVVLARFSDLAGNVSDTLSDAIVLDQVPPTPPRLAAVPAAIVNLPDLADCATEGALRLALAMPSVDDNLSHYEIRGGHDGSSACMPLSSWVARGAQTDFTFYLLRDQVNLLQVRSLDRAGNVGDPDFVIVTEDSTPPAPPTNVTVTPRDGRAYLSWDPSSDHDVAGYLVYYGSSPEPPFDGTYASEGFSPLDVGPVSSYRLSGLTNGSPTYVRVTAYDHTQSPAANESTNTDVYLILPDVITPELLGSFESTDAIFNDVVEAGSLAFVAGTTRPTEPYDDPDHALFIFDLSRPDRPRLVGRYDGLWGEGLGVFVHGTRAYLAARGGDWTGTRALNVLDVSRPSAPVLIGSYGFLDQHNMVKDVHVAGRYAYVANGWGGLKILDVSTPALDVNCNPGGVAPPAPQTAACKGWLGGPGQVEDAQAVTVAGVYAYIADGSYGLKIVNVANPAAPSLVGTFNSAGFSARDVAKAGTYAYVAWSGLGLVILNVANPAAPALVSSFSFDGAANGVQLAGQYALVATGRSGVALIDISRPTHPTMVGSTGTLFPQRLDYSKRAVVSGTGISVVGDSGTLARLALARPTAPAQQSYKDAFQQPHGVALAGSQAYVSTLAREGTTYYHFLDVFDIADASQPMLVGRYRLNPVTYDTDEPEHVVVQDALAYVALGPYGLRIIDVSSPKLGQVCPASVDCRASHADAANFSAQDLALSGRTAFVASATYNRPALYVFDVSNPASLPAPVTYSIPGGSQARGIDLQGTRLYLPATTGAGPGLEIVDVSNPASPQHLGAYGRNGPTPWDVHVVGRHAFLAGQSYLQVLDISDPTAPRHVADYGDLGFASRVVVSDGVAYLADIHRQRVDMLDVADPAAPRLLATYPLPQSAEDVAVLGPMAYVIHRYAGLHVVRLEP